MDTQDFFQKDTIVFGLLMLILAFVFKTSSSDIPFWKKFYRIVPSVLLCYFVPALCNYPLGLISPEFFMSEELFSFLNSKNVAFSASDLEAMSFLEIESFLKTQGFTADDYAAFIHKSKLYYVASRYLLPACLIFLCLSIDLKGIMNLGPKALIMFLTGTLGIVIGGPLAVLAVGTFSPETVGGDMWRGLSTIAGSWIGGGANQTAMKEIFKASDELFAVMIFVDVFVANLWMAFILYGVGITKKIDHWLKADTSMIEALKVSVQKYQESVMKIPTLPEVVLLLALGFGGTALSHWAADAIAPFMKANFGSQLEAYRLTSLTSQFFWLVVISTTIGVGLSFTKYRRLEGVGASRLGSICIFILVATIGMKINIGELQGNLLIVLVGLCWMAVHVSLMLIVAKLIKAPFFFVAVGSQANVGGAASAPVVASAFSPALAPVGVLMAVLGYALGTYGAIICAYMMQFAAP